MTKSVSWQAIHGAGDAREAARAAARRRCPYLLFAIDVATAVRIVDMEGLGKVIGTC